MNRINVEANGIMYFLIAATMLTVIVVFTKEGNELFREITGWLGIFREEVLLVVVVMLIVMMIININNIDMNPPTGPRKEVRNIVVEGFTPEKDFCGKYVADPDVLHEKCTQFNEDSCNATSCCVWLNSEKCVGGNKFGPTYYSDDNMEDIKVRHYHHQWRCRGDCEEDGAAQQPIM